jgi:hypothetical protein
MHHVSGSIRFVKSKDEEDSLGEEYSRQPQDGVVAEAAVVKSGECESCIKLTMEIADLKVVFDKSWKQRAEEHASAVELLNGQIETLKSRNEALTKELEKKRAKAAA